MHPYLLHFGHFALPTFGVLAAVGLMLALLLGERTAPLAGVDADALWNAGAFAVLAAFALSRVLLAVVFWRSFMAFPLLLLAVPSLTATGLWLTMLATALWLRWRGVSVLAALDAWAPAGTLLWAALALGHFAEGSDPGIPTTLPWAIAPMPGEATHVHPVALYAAALGLAGTVALLAWLRRTQRRGRVAAGALAGVGVAQFVLSFVRQPGLEAPLGLDTLQWVAVGMIVAGAVLALSSEPRAQSSAPRAETSQPRA